MSKQPRISVLISCFNEEANIAECIRNVAAALPEAEIVGRDGALGLRHQEVPVSYASRRKGNSQHANTADGIKAGMVLMAKSIAGRIRTGASHGTGS